MLTHYIRLNLNPLIATLQFLLHSLPPLGDSVPHCPCTNLTASAYQTPAMSGKTSETPPIFHIQHPFQRERISTHDREQAGRHAYRQMRPWMQIQIIRETSLVPWKSYQSQSLFLAFMCMCAPSFSSHSKDWQDKQESSFVPPLCPDMYSKTVTCRPRPLCFNNTSLDPPMRGGGPDMKRCDSSGAADTIAGFSFDCLAGYKPQRTFFHY